MGRYTNIESYYIKKKVLGLSWDRNSYIDNLLSLYNYIKNPPSQWFGKMQFATLKTQYQEEYLDLLKEHSYEMYETEIERQKKFQEEKQKSLQELKKELATYRLDWIKAGGKNITSQK